MRTNLGFGPGSPVPDRYKSSTGVKDILDEHGEILIHDLNTERSPHVGGFGSWIAFAVEGWR